MESRQYRKLLVLVKQIAHIKLFVYVCRSAAAEV